MIYGTSVPLRDVEVSIPKDPQNEWIDYREYEIDEEVKVESEGRIYTAIQAVPINTKPIDNPLFWEPSVLNRTAFMDDLSSSQTVFDNILRIEFTASNIDMISLFNLRAHEVRVILYFEEERVFDRTCSTMMGDLPMDRFVRGIPNLGDDVRVAVYIRPVEGSTMGLGHLTVSKAVYTGCSQEGGAIGVKDYGYHKRNDWGYISFTESIKIDSMEIPVRIDEGMKYYTRTALKAVIGKPCVWVADDDEDAPDDMLVLYGFFVELVVPARRKNLVYTLKVDEVV